MVFDVDFNDIYDGSLILLGVNDLVEGILFEGIPMEGTSVQMIDSAGYSCSGQIIDTLVVNELLYVVMIDWTTWQVGEKVPFRFVVEGFYAASPKMQPQSEGAELVPA